MRRNETTPVRVRLANAALGLLTVLALLAAPVCAPLCAGKICASGMPSARTSHEPCHEVARMEPNGGEQYVATNKTCGATDFPAMLIKADEQSQFGQIVHDDSAPVLIGLWSQLGLESFGAGPGSRGVDRVPLESNPSVPLNTILRI